MVVFTCGHCGESVQKPKVEKHYLTKCRNKNPNLSCMDCFKDFLGNDYESHIKCITEEERYSGKGFQAKEKKGEKKQNAWVEMLQSVLDEQKSASNNVLRIIETISKHNNTPRKKPKFINFVKNVCGHRTNPKDIDQAWEMISVKLSELATVTQNKNQNQSGKPTANGTAEKENDNDDEDNTDQNGVNESKENANIQLENGRPELESGNTELKDGNDEQENETETVNIKKLSKKQRKEEKKRRKYEAELQSAELPPEETEDTEVTKKGKKKNRTESANHDDESQESKKEKKRKRQDTINCPSESENIETNTVVLSKEKLQKKKQKCEEDEAEESICLHDQNVAKIEALAVNNGKFNWHAVIVSVLEKKGNELPFKRLQKKVLSEYSEATGCEVDDRIAEKFIKRLKSIPNVRVDKNRVLLIE